MEDDLPLIAIQPPHGASTHGPVHASGSVFEENHARADDPAGHRGSRIWSSGRLSESLDHGRSIPSTTGLADLDEVGCERERDQIRVDANGRIKQPQLLLDRPIDELGVIHDTRAFIGVPSCTDSADAPKSEGRHAHDARESVFRGTPAQVTVIASSGTAAGPSRTRAVRLIRCPRP